MTKKPKDVERPYVVDGLKEYDNPLPSWWLGLFWFTILFSAVYMVHYHVMSGPSIEEERQQAELAFAAQQKEAPTQKPEQTATAADALKEGREIYATNCSPCHGQAGEGIVGPNLTDRYWLHGNSREAILKVISEGVPSKGMVAWKTILGPTKIEHVTTFIMSLKGTNPANAKAPQGEPYDP